MRNTIIEQDLPDIREAIVGFERYSFSSTLSERMKERSLSSAALGKRAGVSHTMVDKWLKEEARPNGKERMKELGMGLGMDAEELNAFLYRSGYPRLYVKNPLDSVAIQLLKTARGREDIVSIYRELLDVTRMDRFKPKAGDNDLRTSVMLSGLMKQVDEDLEQWLQDHRNDFVANSKSVIPDPALADYLRLYIGAATANALAATEELPAILVPTLTALLNGKSVTVRGLREKLMALGLYLNMTEEEIDVLLDFVRLRPLTEPVDRMDMALLLSVREAHERYALYEYDNLERIVKHLRSSEKREYKLLYPEYAYRLRCAKELADYYLRFESGDEEREFEERYTSYGDHGLMDYVRDVLNALLENGVLSPQEVGSFPELITRPEEGEKAWN